MLNPQDKVLLFGAIDNMVEEFLDNEFEDNFNDPEKTVVTLQDKSGVVITIDISKWKKI